MPVTFAVNRQDIHQGPGSLFYNVAVPANAGRVLVDANGNIVTSSPAWAASTAYSVGQEVYDSNGNVEVVTVAGTSGASAPAWNATVGSTTTDGSVTWLNLGPPIPLGAEDGNVVFHMAGKFEEISMDQEAAPIDVVMTAEGAQIDCTLKESALAKVLTAVAHGTYASGTDTGLPAGVQAYEELTVGGLVAIAQRAIALVSPRRGFTNKYYVGCLYSGYASEAFQFPMTRTKASVYKVTWKGIALTWRAKGDRLAKLYRQT